MTRQNSYSKTSKSIRSALIVLLTVSFIALILNWLLFKIVGQKSADRVEHSLVAIVSLIGYLFYTSAQKLRFRKKLVVFSIALVPSYFGSAFPDLDISVLGIGGHRNPLFHSSLSFILLYYIVHNKNLALKSLLLGFGIGLASHLVWDIAYYGDVRWIPGSVFDKLWLGLNAILIVYLLNKK